MVGSMGIDVGIARLVSPVWRRRWLADRLTGWPLVVLFVGFPVWWVLGLTQIMCMVIAGVMTLQLLRQRHVLVPAAFGIWLLFVAWTLTGPFVAQVVAPGSEPAVQLSRYFTWIYRLSFFLVGTVALAYITTFRLSAARIGRMLASMFVVVVAGGLLGVLAPHLSFPSLIELGLPHRLDANPFIHAQVHPTPAELQDYLGDVRARPSAPFAYSNSWGVSYALMLPFFVASWLSKDAGWRRVAAPFVLVISLVPVVYSLNRGLWAALIVAVVFVALRSAFLGHLRLLATVLVVVAAVATLVLTSPLGTKIETRLQGHNSNEGRTNLSSLAVKATATGSPVVGFGTTRRVQGSFNSIAQGATTQCRLCSPPALGTQGQLWTVTFSFGLLGAAFFLAFFCYHFFRRLRSRTAADTTSLTVLLIFLITLPIYDANYPGMIAVMGAVCLLDRSDTRRERSLGALTARLRRHWRVVAACTLLGGVAGAASQLTVAPVYQATTSVAIPLGTMSPGQHTEQVTLDDVSQQAKGNEVTQAVARSLGITAEDAGKRLMVTATPNTRILHLTFTAHSAKVARTGAETARAALLGLRADRLQAQAERETTSDSHRLASMSGALRTLRRSQRRAPEWELLSPLTSDALSLDLRRAQEDLLRSETMDVRSGTRLGPPVVKHQLDDWFVWTTSGAALGLLLGAALATWVLPRTKRLGSLDTSNLVLGTSIMLYVDAATLLADQLPAPVQYALEHRTADACLAIDTDPVSLRVASTLDHRVRRIAPESSGRSVILVGTTRTRRCRLESEMRHLGAHSVNVAGVVLLTDRPGDHIAANPQTLSRPQA